MPALSFLTKKQEANSLLYGIRGVRSASPVRLALRGFPSPSAVIFLLFPDSLPSSFQVTLELLRKSSLRPGGQGLRRL